MKNTLKSNTLAMLIAAVMTGAGGAVAQENAVTLNAFAKTDGHLAVPASGKWEHPVLVTQGDRARTIDVANLRAEAVSGSAEVAAPNAEAGAPTAKALAVKAETAAPRAEAAASKGGATPYPGKDQPWPGKGVTRAFGFMVGERNEFWKHRQQDQGAIVFVGDSLTGGWKTLAKDLPKFKVANRGVGGDVSRGVVFRFKEDVLDLNPQAVVIEIGNNDLTAMGAPSDMLSNLSDILAQAEQARPDMPVVLCTIPSSANPKAPVRANDRKAMNAGIRKIASERKNTYFCDLFAATANDDGSPKLEYFAADKLHLSGAGHTKWAELLTPIFDKLNLK